MYRRGGNLLERVTKSQPERYSKFNVDICRTKTAHEKIDLSTTAMTEMVHNSHLYSHLSGSHKLIIKDNIKKRK